MSSAQPTSATVAITGLDARDNPHPGIGVATCLRNEPAFRGRIVGLTYDPLCTGAFRSELFDAVYLMPLPTDPQLAYRDRLASILEREPIDVIIPTLDTEVPLYARLQPWLHAHGVEMFGPSEQAVKSRSKLLLRTFESEHGIRTPRAAPVYDIDAFLAARAFGYPFYLKGNVADAVRVDSAAAARTAYNTLLSRWGYPVLAQESIRGHELNIAAVAFADRAPEAVAARKLVVSDLGKALASVTIDDPQLEDYAHHIVNALAWRGPCELEIMREEPSGRLYLVEINARFPAWIALAQAAGTNLVWATVCAALGQPRPLAKPKTGMLYLRHKTMRTMTGATFGNFAVSGQRPNVPSASSTPTPATNTGAPSPCA